MQGGQSASVPTILAVLVVVGTLRFAHPTRRFRNCERLRATRAPVDFQSHSPNTWTKNRRTPVANNNHSGGGHDADFTQDAAEDFRGCRRCIQPRLDTRAGPGRIGAHRADLRPDRAVRGGRVGGVLDRHADRHRPRQREGRHRRQVQGRSRPRRLPEQAGCRDQRGQPPDRPGEDRHPQRRFCQFARGPAGGQGRAAEEDPLDHDRGLHRRVQGQEPAIRLPRADPFRPVRPGLCRASSPSMPRPSSAWSPRTSRSR